ncbi:coiled-coil domain-containing protein [Nocardiopsis coralliicola]
MLPDRVPSGEPRGARADAYADFWAPDPPCPPELRDAPRTRPALTAAARAALAGAVLAGLLGAPSAAAAPVPAESLSELQDRADALSEEYNGELRDMEGVFEDAEKAQERADKTQDEVDSAREQVQQLAIASYTSGGIDPSLAIFVEEDPQQLIDQAQLVGHLSSNHQERIDSLEQAIGRDEKARDNAQEKADSVQEDLDELEGRREEVQGLIADHPQQEMGPPDNLTPRTRQMRDVITEEFGENTKHGGVGCYRAEGGFVVGEHPKGRACDFMVDKNGQMPSEEQQEHGDEIAAWAQENADRLGIMYIIYQQKIWDIRRDDEGWRDMSDRGSITENHFDHVHISMF